MTYNFKNARIYIEIMSRSTRTVPFASTETLFPIPFNLTPEENDLYVKLAAELNRRFVANPDWPEAFGGEGNIEFTTDLNAESVTHVYLYLKRICMSTGISLYLAGISYSKFFIGVTSMVTERLAVA